MIFAFVEEHKTHFAIHRMCTVLGVSQSGYYAWRKREPSQRAKANEKLLEKIREIFKQSRQTYGSPRIYQALRQQGTMCGRHRVARLMRVNQISARRPRRKRPHTTQRNSAAAAAPNLLKGDFKPLHPNQAWVSDITYIDTAEGWLYLAAVLDLFARPIVGWAMEDHMQSSLVEAAFSMAVMRRSPEIGWIHHSDQGSQYTCHEFRALLARAGCQPSNSSVGNCFDNAVMESFFSTLKGECAYYPFKTRAEARTVIFEYIEVWYNRKRLHSSLGYLSPARFEQVNSDIFCIH